MSYQKPDGLLLSKPSKRRTKKSMFLRKLEAMQKDKGLSRIAEAAKTAADAMQLQAVISMPAKTPLERENKQRRVVQLTTAYSRRREK